MYEELVELEENWTELVDKVDQELAGGQNTLILREEDHIPGHTALKTIRLSSYPSVLCCVDEMSYTLCCNNFFMHI